MVKMTNVETINYYVNKITLAELDATLLESIGENYLPLGSSSRIYHFMNSTLIVPLKNEEQGKKGILKVFTNTENKESLENHLKKIFKFPICEIV